MPGSAHYISPQQLCVGLYVHVDLPWMEHPFTFSSFKIKNAEQIATLLSLNMAQIRFSPEKSDVKPRPLASANEVSATDSPPLSPQPSSPISVDEDPAYKAKRERVARLAAQRAKVSACEREFLSAAKSIKEINQHMFSRPTEAYRCAVSLIDTMSESLLTDSDVAINLMNDQVVGEDVYYHSLNVTVLALMLAKELKISTKMMKPLGLGALFHDVGKIEIPDKVLRKTEPLSRAEQNVMRQHCAYGVEIGKKMQLAPEVLTIIAQHHEFIDGTGYPQGLQAEQMGPLVKIVSVVNTYDNLCNPSDPAQAMTPHDALSHMYAHMRKCFDDPTLVTMIRCLGVYPPGTIVVLSNDAIGIVVSVNSTRPLKPVVLIYDANIPKEEAMLVDLELEEDLTVSRTLKQQQLPRPMREYLSPRKRVTYYFGPDSHPK